MEYVKQLCVQYVPAVYSFSNAPPWTTVDEAEEMLRPFIDKGLGACAVLGNGMAVYFSKDGTRTEAPKPLDGIRLPLRLSENH
jgi:hypothetical protein